MSIGNNIALFLSLMSLTAEPASSTWSAVGEDTDCCPVYEAATDLYDQEELAVFVLTDETIEQLMDDYVKSDSTTRYSLMFVKETKK